MFIVFERAMRRGRGRPVVIIVGAPEEKVGKRSSLLVAAMKLLLVSLLPFRIR